MFHLDELYAYMKQLLKSADFQHGLFFLLLLMGIMGEVHWFSIYGCRCMPYVSTNLRLAALRPALTNDHFGLTNLSGPLPIEIDGYSFWLKFFILYFMSIMIGMIYACHSTVRYSHCLFVFSILGTVIFHTDLVFYSNRISVVAPVACFLFSTASFIFEDFMPHKSSDPLFELCEKFASPIDSNTILHGDSKCARFYQWVTKVKRKWGIREEKLIFTLIGGSVINVLSTWFVLTR